MESFPLWRLLTSCVQKAEIKTCVHGDLALFPDVGGDLDAWSAVSNMLFLDPILHS